VFQSKRSRTGFKEFPDPAALKELDVFGQGKLKWLYLFTGQKLIKEGRISHFPKKRSNKQRGLRKYPIRVKNIKASIK
jgi:hypothetical protein